MRYKVAIAMATYNGQKFLKEQLSSLASQSMIPDVLYVRDDNSSDKTFEILTEFKKAAPFKVIINKNPKGLGVKQNFSLLISECDADYIFLCDQDDVWLPEKIEFMLKEIQKNELNTPSFCYCTTHVVNENLETISHDLVKMENSQHLQDRPAQNSLVLQNYIPGCSVVINRALKDLVSPIPNDCYMHDWYLTLAALFEGRIIHVDKSGILYRQHSSNTVGTKKKGLLEKFKNKDFSYEYLNQILGQLKILNIKIANDEIKTVLEAFQNRSAKNFFFLMNNHYWPQSFSRRVLFAIRYFNRKNSKD